MILPRAYVLVTNLLALLGPVMSIPLTNETYAPVVDLGYSQYQGVSLSSGVDQYLGIRFAAPPLGDLRFRAPSPPPQISGIQNATEFQPICYALGAPPGGGSTSESEDCLFLNVWSPTSATAESKLPVWVFIQGGGYTQNSNFNYNGSTVVEKSGQNIVFVNFNYRVGAFGFLASEKVRQDGELNVGLLDQRSVLEWVQSHIEQFGGDPNHVVIHGASAGAGSVALHLSAYGGRDDGLIAGAIGQSIFFPTQPQVADLEWQFERYATSVGCAETNDTMSCLRSQDSSSLQTANIASPYPGKSGAPLFYYTPTIDGSFIQDYPYRLFEEGKFIKVPTLIGGDTDEGSYFGANASSPAEVAAFMENNYPKLTSSDTDAINAVYPLMAPLPRHNAYFPSASAAYGEATFTCPGNYISNLSAMNDQTKIWNYRYDVLSVENVENGLGVPHTFEIPALFGLGNTRDDVGSSSYGTYNADVIPIMMNYFISFIRDLNPNTYKYSAAPVWEDYGDPTLEGRRLLFQTNVTRMEEIPKEQALRCEFWKGLVITMQQ
ncbi:hypothetical protein HYFRA_00011316 [Hymenoscyphus fraxineus]|uniref:Carboxylic ester hydrolase n=1 Tax=Hymenoscyphus fraxineus TaxID=746836 RepID=A0A9N9KZB6_9HELO|nr:hypothetical protein HYFRA_00011316 [Hymenoscyphus fraxineus]